VQVAAVGGTYAFNSTILLDRPRSDTRGSDWAQRLPTSTRTSDWIVLKIPGTNGPDHLQGGIPSFQVTGWANLGNPNTGNPFLFPRQSVCYNLESFVAERHPRVEIRGWTAQDQQINHFQPQGGNVPDPSRGTFQFSGSATALQNWRGCECIQFVGRRSCLDCPATPEKLIS